jgi:prepilin-type N-terminal cleavage/methylation domain-containing protein
MMAQGRTHTRRRIARPSAGFTLIELLVTMALLVVLLYMLATAFSTAQRAFADTRTSVAVAQTARAIMDMMRDELMCAKLVKLGSGQRLLFEGTDGGSTGSDTLTYTTDAFQAARSKPNTQVPSLPQVVEVRYLLQGNVVMKQVDWDNDLNNDNVDPAEGIGFNIKSLNFRYYDKRPLSRPPVRTLDLPRWTSDGKWKSDGISQRTPLQLPAAVEITLVVEWLDSRSTPQSTPFSQIVYLPESEAQ